MNKNGMSAGFAFFQVGGVGMEVGRNGRAAIIAACTSIAAPSIERVRSNCMVTFVEPIALVEFIESNPAMVLNCRSSGVATAEAMVSALAPGRVAVTVMVGKSTAGRSLTGSKK